MIENHWGNTRNPPGPAKPRPGSRFSPRPPFLLPQTTCPAAPMAAENAQHRPCIPRRTCRTRKPARNRGNPGIPQSPVPPDPLPPFPRPEGALRAPLSTRIPRRPRLPRKPAARPPTPRHRTDPGSAETGAPDRQSGAFIREGARKRQSLAGRAMRSLPGARGRAGGQASRITSPRSSRTLTASAAFAASGPGAAGPSGWMTRYSRCPIRRSWASSAAANFSRSAHSSLSSPSEAYDPGRVSVQQVQRHPQVPGPLQAVPHLVQVDRLFYKVRHVSVSDLRRDPGKRREGDADGPASSSSGLYGLYGLDV